MLYKAFYTPCVKLTETKTKDGAGGYTTAYTEGDSFEAAIVLDNSSETVSAEQQTLAKAYTVTADTETFKYHEIIKRLSDGKTFRITSDSADASTPSVASFQFNQATAEEWEVPS